MKEKMINKLKNVCEICNIDFKFIKFLFTGGLNTLFGWALFSTFIFLKVPFQIANLLTLICGIIFNFKTTGILVFKSHNNALIFKFFAVYLISYPISTAALALFDHFKLFNMYVAFIIVVIPMAILTFTLFKKWVFTEESPKKIISEEFI